MTLLTSAVVAVTLSRVGRTYSTSASVLVTPLPEGSAGFVGIGTVVDTGDPARTVQTAAALIDTPNAAAAAARSLGPPWTESSVDNAVTVTPEGASDVLSVTATASSPTTARRVANTFALSAVAYRARVVQGQIGASIVAIEARLTQLRGLSASSAEVSALATAAEQLRAVQGTGGEPTLSVSQTAPVPTSPNGTSTALVLLLALVGGFVLGSVAALGLETFSRPVRDREEIERLYPVPVLAALPSVHRPRGVRSLPPWTLPPDAFEQLRMLRVQLSIAGGGRVILVTSAGSGDGKTTVTAALAAAFAEAGQSVALIDLDLRKPDLLRVLQVDRVQQPARKSGKGRAAAALRAVPDLPGVHILPAPAGDLTTVESVVQRVPRLIAVALESADIVLIDTAPVGEVSEALRIAGMCDQVVFVARPRHTDRRRLVLARDLLDRAGIRPLGMVLVGRETGMPRGGGTYAYAMTPLEGHHANGAVGGAVEGHHANGAVGGAVEGHHANGAAGSEQVSNGVASGEADVKTELPHD